MSQFDWQPVVDALRNKDEAITLPVGESAVVKELDKEMGFGVVSSSTPVDCRVVLQAPNPFIDNYLNILNPGLGCNIPYSQIYDVKRKSNDGSSFLFLRHYLHVPQMSNEELNSIMVAVCESNQNFSGQGSEPDVLERKTSVVTTTSTSVRKSSSASSSSKLLGQMERKVLGESQDGIIGYFIITVHKALNVEKKGLVGKADPYLKLQYNDQSFKSKTIDNNQNPVWHFTSTFKISNDDPDKNVLVQLYDDDIGKDDFLGEHSLNIQEVIRSGNMINKTVDLQKCKTGNLVYSYKFVPSYQINNKIGELSLIIHGANKLEKKNKLKKADPYVVSILGEVSDKSPTLSNTSNPKWEHKIQFDVLESSPLALALEVYDDDIGKDPKIGNITIDLNDVMNGNKVEAKVALENCKSGDLTYSAFFVASQTQPEPETVIEETIVTRKETRQDGNYGSSGPNVNFASPLFIDREYLVMESPANDAWLMVVSPKSGLPIETNMVPFKKYTMEKSPIFFKCLPAGGFHNVKRVVHSGKQLRKCGYEAPCVLRAGDQYQLVAKAGKDKVNLGNFVPETWGRDTMEIGVEKNDKSQDIFELIIKKESDKKEVDCTVTLYDNISDAA